MKNRVILITGANRGIGLAIVEAMSSNEKDTVLLGCRDISLGEEACGNLQNNVHPVHLDLNDIDGLSSSLDKIVGTYGAIDVLINNAGVLYENGLLDIDAKELKGAIDVNLLGPLELTKLCLPSMIKKNYGRIINMSSGWGSFTDGLTGPFSYSLTKAALNALTLISARDLPKNVKVNSMCPGWVRTRMGGEGATRSVEEGADTAVWLANSDENGASGKFFRDREQIPW